MAIKGRQGALRPPRRGARPGDTGGDLRQRADRAGCSRSRKRDHDSASRASSRGRRVVSGIELRAMLELVLVGGFCGAIGFWVVAERLTYAAESLSHGLLPGLVLAGL